ncbi:hypothetical protein APR12_002070 [Nocardia amikacinitolerans]|nr:hypothetical protein [Nocardia amikacinitolerans]
MSEPASPERDEQTPGVPKGRLGQIFRHSATQPGKGPNVPRKLNPNDPTIDRLLDQIEELIDELKLVGCPPMRLALAAERWRGLVKDRPNGN